jgi:D-alanine-D-alanine ligase
MEANLVPGMTAGSSYFPKACEIEGEISYDKMIGLILDEGLRRISISLADNIPVDPLPLVV